MLLVRQTPSRWTQYLGATALESVRHRQPAADQYSGDSYPPAAMKIRKSRLVTG
jgi:hypothetical protein